METIGDNLSEGFEQNSLQDESMVPITPKTRLVKILKKTGVLLLVVFVFIFIISILFMSHTYSYHL
jgi:hypothetical protein